MMIIEYFKNYVPEYFDIEKLLDKKYRCIRYFEDKDFNTYNDKQCQPYIYHYMLFKLEKSRYIYMHYAYNLIVWSLFIFAYYYL